MDLNRMNSGDLPVGFGLALAQDPDALQKFASLGDVARADVLRRAHAAGSKEEMRALVASMISGDWELNP